MSNAATAFVMDMTPDVTAFVLIAGVMGVAFLTGILLIARASQSRSKTPGVLGAIALAATVAMVPALGAATAPTTSPSDQLIAHVTSLGGAVMTAAEAERMLDLLDTSGEAVARHADGSSITVTRLPTRSALWR